MGKSRRFSSIADVSELQERLSRAREHARSVLRRLIDEPNFLSRLKFERLGCDPIDEEDAQNLAEQIDQQATYEAALAALELLMVRHPGHAWEFAPGAHGGGHDIASADGQVVAEVFAAVDPRNNDKLRKDISKVSAANSAFRYVVFRSPATAPAERLEGLVTIISL